MPEPLNVLAKVVAANDELLLFALCRCHLPNCPKLELQQANSAVELACSSKWCPVGTSARLRGTQESIYKKCTSTNCPSWVSERGQFRYCQWQLISDTLSCHVVNGKLQKEHTVRLFYVRTFELLRNCKSTVYTEKKVQFGCAGSLQEEDYLFILLANGHILPFSIDLSPVLLPNEHNCLVSQSVCVCHSLGGEGWGGENATHC